MNNIPEIFAEMVFDRRVMRARLPKEVYAELERTIRHGGEIGASDAAIIANAMRDWAVEKGATHFMHWFQPISGIPSEKRDSFISPTADGGVIMELSGDQLINNRAESVSIMPGGSRDAFEKRGYTSWDPTSYAFVINQTLYIPTAFRTYDGQAMDRKTPLLRSMDALNRELLRILKLFGCKNTGKVYPVVGAEQEYYLIDKSMVEKRQDIKLTGRTLFGAEAPKGQKDVCRYTEKPEARRAEFMRELDRELWRLGVPVKTEHKETSPCQFEIAPCFTIANLAADQNYIIMALLRRIADKHGFACLLHEKPFNGIGGSSKHINWSLATDDGINLFEPGRTPKENARFLLFLCAVTAAIEEHQDLLRLSVATAANDCRLGSCEAPATIISVFLGEQLTTLLNAIADEMPYNPDMPDDFIIGEDALPIKGGVMTDKNRTSPIAFTGDKFELRMVGSGMSAAGPNVVMNTIVADKLREFADILEKASDFGTRLDELIKETVKKHRRIIFNGNNYSYEWIEESRRRGLLNFATVPDAMVCLMSETNISLFKKTGVYTESEMRSKSESMYEEYCEAVCIEGSTMVQMLRHQVLPAACKFAKMLAETAMAKKKRF